MKDGVSPCVSLPYCNSTAWIMCGLIEVPDRAQHCSPCTCFIRRCCKPRLCDNLELDRAPIVIDRSL